MSRMEDRPRLRSIGATHPDVRAHFAEIAWLWSSNALLRNLPSIRKGGAPCYPLFRPRRPKIYDGKSAGTDRHRKPAFHGVFRHLPYPRCESAAIA
jgi:hypothetical protein